MTYAIVEDIAASWESYLSFAAGRHGLERHGLILHAAGRTDEGVRVIEVWESEEAWRASAAASHRAAASPPRHLRELRPTHLVVPGVTAGSPIEEAHHA